MGQEAEKQINFEDLKAIVDNAIKNKDISAIMAIKDERQLKYMQKYTEMLLSKNELDIGYLSLGLAIAAIGISYILIAADVSILLLVTGGFLSILGIVIAFFEEKTPQGKREEFMHEIILIIEEKLLSKIPDIKIEQTNEQTN